AAALGSTPQKCALGAVKTNLGHLEAAAGIASLLKTVLQIHHAEIVPHAHLGTVNPLIPLSTSRFHVPRTRESWPETGIPRRAGISSFGFGGTNAHAIVAGPPDQSPVASVTHSVQVLPLSARTPEALRELARRYVDWLVTHP